MELKYFKEIEVERKINKRLLMKWKARGMKAVRLSEGYATTDEWLDNWIEQIVENSNEKIIIQPTKRPKYKPLNPNYKFQENKVY